MKALLFGALLAALASACKQDEGERCQVSSDCSGDLICNLATFTCASENSKQLDADLPIDGPVIDAPTDAAPDAPVLPDASVPDAAPDAS